MATRIDLDSLKRRAEAAEEALEISRARERRVESRLDMRDALLRGCLDLLNASASIGNGPGSAPWRGWMRKMSSLRAEIKKVLG